MKNANNAKRCLSVQSEKEAPTTVSTRMHILQVASDIWLNTISVGRIKNGSSFKVYQKPANCFENISHSKVEVNMVIHYLKLYFALYFAKCAAEDLAPCVNHLVKIDKKRWQQKMEQ